MNRKTLKINTVKSWNDITDDVEDFIKDKGNGVVMVFSKHTTLGIKIYEPELLLLADTQNFLEDLAPRNGKYNHDKIDLRQTPEIEPINGHSHLKSLFFNTSELIPFSNGKLILGTWQRVFAIELDNKRDREVLLKII